MYVYILQIVDILVVVDWLELLCLPIFVQPGHIWIYGSMFDVSWSKYVALVVRYTAVGEVLFSELW